MEKFFGINYEFKVDEFKDHGYLEIKLNGRYFTELGTGICKIVQYIYYLSLFSFKCNNPEFEYLLDNENTSSKFLDEIKNSLRESKLTQGFTAKNIVVLEEPETNLHPDFQSLFAEMIFEISSFSKFHFIVETHSEYIIRTLQVKGAEDKMGDNFINIVNFGTGDNYGKVKNINIKNNGTLSESFYPGFFDVSHELQYKLLLKIGANNN